eukprot:1780130-Pleurochrysis_carterae.AAC.1
MYGNSRKGKESILLSLYNTDSRLEQLQLSSPSPFVATRLPHHAMPCSSRPALFVASRPARRALPCSSRPALLVTPCPA